MFPVISDADQLTTVTTHAVFIVRPVVPFARCQKIKNKIFRKISKIFFKAPKVPVAKNILIVLMTTLIGAIVNNGTALWFRADAKLRFCKKF